MQDNKNTLKLRRKRSLGLPIFAAVIVLALLAVWLLRPAAELPEVVLGRVDYADFDRTLDISARVQPYQEQYVVPEAELTVAKLFVSEGQRVQRGDPLIQFDVADLEKDLAEVKNQIKDLRESLEKGESDPSLFDSSLIQQSLLSSLPQAFQIPDLSALSGLSQVLGQGLNLQSLAPLATLLDQAVELINQAGTFVDQIKTMVDYLEKSPLTDDIQKLAGLLGQQVTWWKEYHESALTLLKAVDEVIADPQSNPELHQAILDYIKQAEDTGKTIDDLLKRLALLTDAVPALPSVPSVPVIPGLPTAPQTGPDQATPAPTSGDRDAADPPQEQTAPPPTDGQPSAVPETPVNEQPAPAPTSAPDPAPLTGPEEGTNPSVSVWPSEPAAAEGFRTERMFAAGGGDLSVRSGGQAMAFNLSDLSGLNTGDLSSLQSLMSTSMQQGQSVLKQLEQRETLLSEQIERWRKPVQSDYSGFVAELAVAEKDRVQAGQTALSVYDDSRLIASFEANRRDAARIQVGQPVSFKYDELKFSGEVTYKSPIAQVPGSGLSRNNQKGQQSASGMDSLGMLSSMSGLLQNSSSALSGDRSVSVKMSVEGEDLSKVVVGFDIDCSIQVDHAEHVVSVPAEALWLDQDKEYVYVLDAEDRLVRREIQVGIQSERFSEILSGVEVGESVVLNPRGNFSEGQKVRVRD